jgi:hypothetical protein
MQRPMQAENDGGKEYQAKNGGQISQDMLRQAQGVIQKEKAWMAGSSPAMTF